MPLIRTLGLATIAGLAAHSAVGGWAVISVENPPESLEAGATYRLEYSVRQHGSEPLTGLNGALLIQPDGSGDAVSVNSTPGSARGRYVATFKVPETGRVILKIKSGFGGAGWGELTLLPIPIVHKGQALASFAPAERGRQLFVAKGCGTCHVNGDVPEFARMNKVVGAGPELTGRRLEAAYVRQRLTNPSSLPNIGDGSVRMPNLGLAPAEVEALVTLISGTTERASQ